MSQSTSRKEHGSTLFRGLSIQQRLPLLICVLLLCVVIAFSWTSYVGVKSAAFDMSKDRLRSLSEQVSSLLSQSAQLTLAGTRAAAANPKLKQYLLTGNNQPDTGVMNVLHKLRTDSTWIRAELLDARRNLLLTSELPNTGLRIKDDSILMALAPQPDSALIGKLYRSGDTICYPVVAAVTDYNKQTIGYLIRWRIQKATARSIAQMSQLLGDNARLLIGNNDGSLWTDFLTVVPPPPVNIRQAGTVFEYATRGSTDVIATSLPMAGTRWTVLIEVSQERITEAATRFVKWILLFGSILVVLGGVIAWVLSRNITRPLNRLTHASTVIASGDYSVKVEANRKDELGQLAHAFNTMAVKVRNVQSLLEKKVLKRTADLEKANKELESFSYSVSHDLRAPLRIINGYTEILMSDYEGKLDEEGMRMLGIIASNAKKMGRLIDDLLNLSQLGRKELVVHEVDMEKLVEAVVAEQARDMTSATILVGPLENAECDSGLIRQVWINLLSNALKYSGKREKPRIEIGSHKTGNEITYFIRDNGVGFDMQYAGKLFGVFQRLHKMTEYEGTGVGLALVQRIVNSHGGKVWAESEVDKGATFYFTLPIVRVAEQKPETANYYDRV